MTFRVNNSVTLGALNVKARRAGCLTGANFCREKRDMNTVYLLNFQQA